MFELFEQQLKNMLRTYRRMAGKIYADLHKEIKDEEALKEEQQKFMEAVQKGRIAEVESEFQKMIATITDLFKLDLEIENLDLLFTNKLGEGITEEVQLADRIRSMVYHMNKKGVDESIQRKLVEKVNSFMKELMEIHKLEIGQVKVMLAQANNQSWNLERMNTEMFTALKDLGVYNTEQYARGLKWRGKREMRDIDKVVEEEELIIKQIPKIKDHKSLEKISHELDDIIKKVKEEDKDFQELLVAIKGIFRYTVHKYFVYMKVVDDQVKKDLETLKQEDFPVENLDDLKQLLKNLMGYINTAAADIKQATKKVHQNVD